MGDQVRISNLKSHAYVSKLGSMEFGDGHVVAYCKQGWRSAWTARRRI